MTLLLALACVSEEPTASTTELPVAPDYGSRGPSEVGTVSVTIVGTDGIELTVQVWYPTQQATGAPLLYDGVFPGDAWDDAPADCATTHPLFAFSHGFGGIRWQSAFITEVLASHGYVAVAPDHRGNTFFDLSGDVDELLLRRPQDVQDVVDWLFDAAADPTSPFVGCVDPAAGYAVAGHSFGGTTALAVAGAAVHDPNGTGMVPLRDDRVWAAVALAPWDGDGAITDGASEVGVPTLVLTGALDETTPLAQVESLWAPMIVEPRYFGVFPEAGHYSFSPAGCLVYTTDGCGDGYIALEVFGPLTDASVGGFLEGVRGVPGATARIPLEAAEITWTVVH